MRDLSTVCQHEWDADVYPPFPPASLLHQSSSCPSELPGFGMAAIDAVSTTVASNSSAMTVANNLRAAGLAIAAYEYVACSFLLTLVVTYRLPVFLSLFLPNSGYTRLQVDGGKKDVAMMRRSRFDWDTPIGQLGLHTIRPDSVC